jgi:PAS domain S-box-containing protein
VLILVAIPVAFEITLVFLLIGVLSRSENSRKELLESRELVGHMNTALTLHLQRSHMMYLDFAGVNKRIPETVASLADKANLEIDEMYKIALRNPKERWQWLQLVTDLKEINLGFESLKKDYYAGNKMAATATFLHSEEQLNHFYSLARTLGKQQDARERELQNGLSQDNKLVSTILTVSAFISAAIAMLMVYLFNKNTAARLDVIMDNTHRIAAGMGPDKRISGEDELAEINTMYFYLYNSLAAARKHERAILENAAQAICSIDHSLKFLDVNPAAEHLWGVPATELVKLKLVDFLPDEEKELVVAQLKEAVKSTSGVQFETKFIRHPDHQIVEAAATVTWSGEENTLYAIFEDITQRRQVEQLKRDFVAMISHDLRTPLTSIQMVLEWIDEDCRENMAPDLVRSLTQSRNSSQLMLSLINSLLQVEQMEAGQLTLDVEEFQIAELVKEAISTVDALAKNKGVEITQSLDETLEAEVDPERMTEVIVNLLANAIKFSPSRSTVTVTLQTIDETKYKLTVSDEGRGIPQGDLPFVFDRFKQVSKADSKRHKGSGLGLAICRSIVRAHGGEIGVQSAEDKGSTFWVTMGLKVGSPAGTTGDAGV